jgi:hypothetical protein
MDGRPKSNDPANTQLPKVRVTQSKLDSSKHAAKKSGKNFSQWTRDSLDKSTAE